MEGCEIPRETSGRSLCKTEQFGYQKASTVVLLVRKEVPKGGQDRTMPTVTSPLRERFVLGQSTWVVMMAVLLILLVAAVLYLR